MSSPLPCPDGANSPALQGAPAKNAATKKPSVESLLRSRWARLFLPSMSDLFFLAMMGWLFMSGPAGWAQLLGDADVGWHIRTGDYVLAHHSVPQKDLFSFSKPDAPWYAWEWGTDVLDSWIHSSAGLKGIVLVAAVVIALFATTLLRRMIAKGTNLFVALAVGLFAVGSASVHFLARPHIFTLLFISASIWMIETDRERRSARIWLLVPLTVVWTNLHGGFLALVAALGLAALGSLIESYLNRSAMFGFDWWRPFRYGVLTTLCALASLVNPYGYRLHQHVLEYLRSDWIKTYVQEFQSPSFRSENMMQYEVLLLCGLVVACVFFQRKRIVEGLWIVFFAHMSLTSVRHVPVFVAVAAPLVASVVSEWWDKATEGAKKASLFAIFNDISRETLAGFKRSSAIPFVAVAALAGVAAPVKWPTDFPSEIFPTQIIQEHANEIFHHRVLTTDQWGDYLIYKDPTQKVYVDGRSDFYGATVGNEYIRLMNGRWDWKETMKKYNFDCVLLPPDHPVVQLIESQPGWRIVADSGKAIFLVRK